MIKRWAGCGVRKLPKRKPSGNKDDMYRVLCVHWELCPRTYADEKQRQIVAAGILMSYIAGCRLVSLFDTRVNNSDEAGESAKTSKPRVRILSSGNGSESNMLLEGKSQLGRTRSSPKILKKRKRTSLLGDEDYHRAKFQRVMPNRRTHRIRQNPPSDRHETDASDTELDR